MNLRLATELQLYKAGLISLAVLYDVAHKVMADDAETDSFQCDPAAVRICYLASDHYRGLITEAQLIMQLPATPEIEVERDTEVSNRKPTPPPSKPPEA